MINVINFYFYYEILFFEFFFFVIQFYGDGFGWKIRGLDFEAFFDGTLSRKFNEGIILLLRNTNWLQNPFLLLQFSKVEFS